MLGSSSGSGCGKQGPPADGRLAGVIVALHLTQARAFKNSALPGRQGGPIVAVCAKPRVLIVESCMMMESGMC